MVSTDNLERALKRLGKADGRIARRNARRAAFGALRSLRHAIDAAYPAVPKPASSSPQDRTASAVKRQSWRHVEYRIVKPGRTKWNRDRAEAFNRWISEQDGHEAKPIKFDMPDRSRFLGLHTSDAIRIAALPPRFRGADAEKWRTFLHEVAHYRARGHGAPFKAELVRIYRLWRQFMAGKVSA